MTLPQNVKDAVVRLDYTALPITEENNLAAWQTIRAHLLSQDAEIERLQSGLAAANERLEAAERDAADAKRWRIVRELDGGAIYHLMGHCDGIHPEQADAAIDATQEGEG